MKEINIISKTHGAHVVLVDDEDYEWLSDYTWGVYKSSNTFYSTTGINISKCIYNAESMHRIIMARYGHDIENKLIDHIDHNGLNNQKYNLRVCTNSDNQRNRRIDNIQTINSKSKYKGVQGGRGSKLTRKPWVSIIWLDGRVFHIGSFNDEVMAAKAYDQVAKYFFGELASTNFKDNEQVIDMDKLLKRYSKSRGRAGSIS